MSFVPVSLDVPWMEFPSLGSQSPSIRSSDDGLKTQGDARTDPPTIQSNVYRRRSRASSPCAWRRLRAAFDDVGRLLRSRMLVSLLRRDRVDSSRSAFGTSFVSNGGGGEPRLESSGCFNFTALAAHAGSCSSCSFH